MSNIWFSASNLKQHCTQMVDFMVNTVLKIIMLETIVHSNGKCTLGNNNVGNNSVCLDMTHIWRPQLAKL